MGQITFLFGVHNHQPIGNFNEVFEEAYRTAYAPFIKLMAEHPTVRWNLHCTGILWEWLQDRHPDYLKRVADMAASGQVELLSGGFYEPILPVIPDADKIGQIQKLNHYLKGRFHTSPKGMWCAERVWEPNLPKYIREAGIEYTVLDDTHFMYSGLDSDDLTGYYRVEDEESSIDVFPISQELRYSIPFKNPEETIKIFARFAEKFPDRDLALVMADDGEKFGFWPGTNKLIYEDHWLEHFLMLLEQNASWIHTDTFSNYRAARPALGKVYLPTASYFEMSEWSLPTKAGLEFEGVVKRLSKLDDWEKTRRFTKGGFWRNFLVKYPEADSMYKKMLYVSRKVHAEGRMNSSGVTNALCDLWAGQCNCSYWHGAFGGLYLPFLRQSIYQQLINAEKKLDEIHFPKTARTKSLSPIVQVFDFDRDGKDEIILESLSQNLYVSPEQGGTIFEWDFKPASVNIANVLTRRPEIYHEKLKQNALTPAELSGGTLSIHDLVLAKETGLENILQYDWYRRANLIDHFLHPLTTLQTFKRAQYGEQGDFVLGRYAHRAKGSSGGARIELSREGAVWSRGQKFTLRVQKTIEVGASAARDRSELRVLYRLMNESDQNIPEVWFAPEFNFSFSVPEKDQEFEPVSGWEKVDPHLYWKLNADFSEPAGLWIIPLETVSNSESGYEKTFQGVTVLPHWKLSLDAGKSFERTLSFRLSKT